MGVSKREENVKSSSILLLMTRWFPDDSTEEGRGSPERGKGFQRERTVKATPPIMAESTIIQSAKVLLSPKPISGDGISHMFDDQMDDVVGGATVEPILLRGSGLPKSTKGGDTEEGPQAEDGSGGGTTRPEIHIVSKNDICRPRQLDP